VLINYAAMLQRKLRGRLRVEIVQQNARVDAGRLDSTRSKKTNNTRAFACKFSGGGDVAIREAAPIKEERR
jgi:hypothetical protein